MKRPVQQPARKRLALAERTNLAARTLYVGSAEHKLLRWWGGLPSARQLPGGRVGRRGQQTTTVYKGWPIDEDERRAIFD